MIKRIKDVFQALKTGRQLMKSEALRDEMRSIAATQRQVEQGDLESADVQLMGADIRLESREGGEMEITSPSSDLPFRGIVFPGSSERPAAYPEDLPFIPNLRTSVTYYPGKGRTNVSWPRSDDHKARMAQLRDLLRAQGWSETRSSRTLFGVLGREVTYSQGSDSCRVLFHRIPGQPVVVRLIVTREAGAGLDVA
jgi:hypothetical protein